MSQNLHKTAEHVHILCQRGKTLAHALACAKEILTSTSNDGKQDSSEQVSLSASNSSLNNGPTSHTLTGTLYNTISSLSSPSTAAASELPAVMASLKPRMLGDSNFSSIIKYFTKKYPDTADVNKQSNFGTHFQPNMAQHCEQMLPFYQLMLEVLEFVESASQLIQKGTFLSAEWSVEWTPDVGTMMIKLVRWTCTNLILWSQMTLLFKVISATYGVTYTYMNGIQEAQFQRVAAMVCKFESGVSSVFLAVGEWLSGWSTCFTNLVCGLPLDPLCHSGEAFEKMEYLKRIRLRGRDENQSGNAALCKSMQAIAEMGDNFTCFVLGILCCPTELFKHPGQTALVKKTFGYSPCVVLARGEWIDLFSECEALCKADPTRLSKFKQLISEVVSTYPPAKMAQMHRERRMYLRKRVKEWNAVCTNRPLIIPFNVLCLTSLLSFVKEEVLWHYAFWECMTSQSKKQSKSNAYSDLQVMELLSESQQLLQSILNAAPETKTYFASFVLKELLRKVSFTISSIESECALPDGLANLFESLSQLINSLGESNAMDDKEVTHTVQSLKMNWMRIQLCFILPGTNFLSESKHYIEALVSTMREVMAHVNLLCNFQDEVVVACSAHQLAHFLPRFKEEVKDLCATGSGVIIRWLGCVLTVCQHFAIEPSHAWASDATALTEIGAQTASEICEHLALLVGNGVDDITQRKLQLNSVQRDMTPTLEPELVDKRGAQPKSPTKKKADDKRTFEEQQNIISDQLFKTKTIMLAALKALGMHRELYIGDAFTLFPMGYLEDVIKQKTEAFLNSMVLNEESTPTPSDDISFMIQRPSVMLSTLKIYIETWCQVEEWSRINLSGIIYDVLMDNFKGFRGVALSGLIPSNILSVNSAGGGVLKLTKDKTSKKSPKVATDLQRSAIESIAMWYSHVLGGQTLSHGASYVFSPEQRSFISKSSNAFRMEHYTSLQEMTSLVLVIGPSGVKTFEESILKMVSILTSKIKDIIKSNRELLLDFKACWHMEAGAFDVMKRMKDMGELFQKCMILGNILSFRELLFRALQGVLTEKTPHLFNWLSKRRASPEEVKVLQDMICMAGLEGGKDYALSKAIEVHCSQEADWSLLPYLFAVCWVYGACDEGSTYRTTIAAMDNNAHTIIYTVHKLIVCVQTNLNEFPTKQPLTNADQNEDLPNTSELIIAMQTQFLQVSALQLLRLFSNPQVVFGGGKDGISRHVPSMLMLLLAFCRLSPYIDQAVFEKFVPYGVVRNTVNCLNSYKSPMERQNSLMDEEGEITA
jgi:hypothetical protein